MGFQAKVQSRKNWTLSFLLLKSKKIGYHRGNEKCSHQNAELDWRCCHGDAHFTRFTS